MKTDIEIARETKLKNIREVAAQVGFPDEEGGCSRLFEVEV